MKISIAILASLVCLLSIQAQNTNQKILTKSNDLQEITWEEVYQTSGGTCFAINSEGDIFAGTGGSWILRSTDNGDTWEQSQLPSNIGGVNSIAINSNDDIFLTTESGFYDGSFCRSTDNGDNWIQLHADSGDYFKCLDINSADAIFFGTWDGVVRSFNNGDNLEQTGWDNQVEKLIISSIDDDIFINSWGVQCSTDNGNNWTNASSGLTNSSVNAFAFNSHDYIFAGTPATEGGVFVSTNNGENWTVTGYSFLNAIDSVVTALGISSENDIFIGTFGLGALYSTDNGATWTEINTGLPTGLIINSFIVNFEGYILAGSSMGIFRSVEPVVVSTEDLTFNMPVSITLEQNYPNPFNPSTKIEYQISELSFATLKVFDILGNETETLFNKEKPAGRYVVEFDGTGKPGGVYFYRLQAGSFVETKKMVLLK